MFFGAFFVPIKALFYGPLLGMAVAFAGSIVPGADREEREGRRGVREGGVVIQVTATAGVGRRPVTRGAARQQLEPVPADDACTAACPALAGSRERQRFVRRCDRPAVRWHSRFAIGTLFVIGSALGRWLCSWSRCRRAPNEAVSQRHRPPREVVVAADGPPRASR